MTYENLIIETSEQFVGTITLNRPEQMNTFTSGLAEDLYNAFLEMDGDASVRVVLVKGAGRAFCAGIDVNELFGKTALEYRAWIEHMERPLVTVSKMSKPVIAQVQGVAAANPRRSRRLGVKSFHDALKFSRTCSTVCTPQVQQSTFSSSST